MTSFSFMPALLLSILSSLFLPSSVSLSYFILAVPCASVWENTRSTSYRMVLALFRQCIYMCTFCIRSEKVEILVR